jgi:dTDP-glucose 4,6-dehydratase
MERAITWWRIDAAFAADPNLAKRYPDTPVARGRPTSELKTFVEDRKGHDRRYAIDETKVRAELGYAPGRNFAEGFSTTLAWYLRNESWWQPLLSRSPTPSDPAGPLVHAEPRRRDQG